MKTYTLMLKMTDRPGDWSARFAFTAKDAADATDKAIGWAYYQGFARDDVRADLGATAELHDEYIR
jgi:hypothetical protein